MQPAFLPLTAFAFSVIVVASLSFAPRPTCASSPVAGAQLEDADVRALEQELHRERRLHELLKYSRQRREAERDQPAAHTWNSPESPPSPGREAALEYARLRYGYDPVVEPSLQMTKFGILLGKRMLSETGEPDDPEADLPDWSSREWIEEWSGKMLDWMCDTTRLDGPHMFLHRVLDVSTDETGGKLYVRAELETTREAFSAIHNFWRRTQNKLFASPRIKERTAHTPLIGRRGEGEFYPVFLKELGTQEFPDWYTLVVTGGVVLSVYAAAQVVSVVFRCK